MSRGTTLHVRSRLDAVEEFIRSRGVVSVYEIARALQISHTQAYYTVKMLELLGRVRCKVYGSIKVCGEVDAWAAAIAQRIKQLALDGCRSRCCGVASPDVIKDINVTRLLRTAGIKPGPWPGGWALIATIAQLHGITLLRRRASYKFMVCR